MDAFFDGVEYWPSFQGLALDRLGQYLATIGQCPHCSIFLDISPQRVFFRVAGENQACQLFHLLRQTEKMGSELYRGICGSGEE